MRTASYMEDDSKEEDKEDEEEEEDSADEASGVMKNSRATRGKWAKDADPELAECRKHQRCPEEELGKVQDCGRE
jgi:hypothetical protein